ncbi:uncharacterized protein [Pyxicephalus adspersus]|uniref:Myb/SANT-like DNA-binding domain-containing protein n=1 Tax=Pyxicephalus adspersus TaxID=30357 RepID=A0AAV3AFK9_PYXAD|nr:TPA: hypothetical protein GDO54_012908 [Pyxicephalus adspersus]
MSEGIVPTRRIGTRAVVRQENSAMVESEASSSEGTSSQTVTTSPTMEANIVPKEEPNPEPVEPPATPVTTATTMTLVTTAVPVPQTSTITAVQVKNALVLQPLGPSPFTGRKRKANFSNEETETLVKYVVTHFSALYGSEALRTESTRRNLRRSQLWNQIQKHVNELGYTPRSIDDLKHKWRDLRLEVKRKITHRRTANKVPPAPGITPIIDTKLTPLEEQVASTIGHHCSLDGEQEGLYIEPGVPRQSIFFNCRGSPGAPMPELGADKLGTASPRLHAAEFSLMSPLVSTSPAQLSFVMSDGDNEEQDMDVTPSATPTVTPGITIKPFPETWSAKDAATLVTTPTILQAQQTIVAATPQILTVKQEVLPTQPITVPARCESQCSTVSSPEGSVSNVTTPAEWNGDNPAPSDACDNTEILKLKVEDEEDDSQDPGKNSPLPESQDEWEGQSASPQPSENAADDSMPSTSSQDGDPSSGTDLPANGDCSCEASNGKDEVKAKMQRLLELEERWDRMYDQELGIWEEERTRQQQQRVQDRELQQQLLSVLTDIRDELRQLRQDRAAARQNQSAANGSPSNTKVEEDESPKAAPETPKSPDQPSTPVSTGKRRGRPPRHMKPAPEPVRSIRPAPGPSSKS